MTKHGRPVAKVVPLDEPPSLEGSVHIVADDDAAWFSTADLVDPVGELDPVDER